MTGLLVALDVPDLERAVQIAREVAPQVSGFKVGLQLLLGPDPSSVERIADLGKPVFVDAKLHDIPATVERAARQLGKRGARWLTIHAGGGAEMLRAGVYGLAEGSNGAGGVLAVTVLTSLDDEQLESLGFVEDLTRQTRRLMNLAVDAKAEGVICSVHEVSLVEDMPLITITPGIRPVGLLADDQKRVATPTMAVEAGASYVVVGRPITGADDMAAAAASISEELSNAIVAAPTDSDR
ncbi:MAG TPA: orotidine-5'-phosphate decarboxylase [Acidimicrobiia bacterium]